MTFRRADRVSGLLRRELASLLQSRFGHELPIGLISITDVEVSRDLSHARIFVAVLDSDQADEVMAVLHEYTPDIRRELAGRVKLRITPSLKFHHDRSSEAGERIEQLLASGRRQPPE